LTLVQDALSKLQNELASSGIPDSRLEAELLLMDSLGKSRASLYASLRDPITPEDDAFVDQRLHRRKLREPLFQILGYREFFGININLTKGVFIPRQETEVLVEEAIASAARYKGNCILADIGTGSGAIAIALALNIEDCHIYATDISRHSIQLANSNVQSHDLAGKITLLKGSLMAPIQETVDIVVGNLPYIPSCDIPSLEPEVRLHDPLWALDGGLDGLSLIKTLIAQLPRKLRPGGVCLLEIDPRQFHSGAEYLQRHFPQARITPILDLTSRIRIISMQTKTP
jgi:release factor glutamine methyltransferase